MAEGDVSFHLDGADFDIGLAENLEDWIRSEVKIKGHSCGDLCFVFKSDDGLLEMNKQYLSHDYYTDVITFPYSKEPVSGDVFISIDRVSENANQEGVAFVDELSRVMIHGVLHLLGYDDKTAELKKEMRALENEALDRRP